MLTVSGVRNKMKRNTWNKEKSDIYVASYPGTGADWVLQLVWWLANDLDFANGLKPMQHAGNNVMYPYGIVQTELDCEALFGTTLPNGKRNKVIYVVKNAEKTCISLYQKGNLDDTIDLDTFCHLFLTGQGLRGSYWDHVASYWLHRNNAEILFVQYDYVQNRLPRAIKKVSDFLGVPLTEYDILSLVYQVSLSSVSGKPNTECTIHPEITKRFDEQNAYYHNKVGLRLDWSL